MIKILGGLPIAADICAQPQQSTAGQPGTFRALTKGQLAVMADKTKPFQADQWIHYTIFYIEWPRMKALMYQLTHSPVTSIGKIAFIDVIKCFTAYCSNVSGFQNISLSLNHMEAHFAEKLSQKNEEL